MSRTTHVCAGCGTVLASKRALRAEVGTVHTAWACRQCGTRVPRTVAERVKHQRQH